MPKDHLDDPYTKNISTNGICISKNPARKFENAQYTNSLLFHESWDWLMPVAIKIGGNNGVVDIDFAHFINCRITDFNINGQQFASDRSTDIECIFNTISSYCIDWCKSQNIEL